MNVPASTLPRRRGAPGVLPVPAVARVNAVALHAPGERVEPGALRERAWCELLRQEAVRTGFLPPDPEPVFQPLAAHEQQAIERLLEQAVPLRTPPEDDCSRYYAAHREDFLQDRRVRVRHILFAARDGEDVHAVARRAEDALLELTRRDVPPGRFAELARALSACPSAAEGGDLGWLAPEDCSEELANELFDEHEPRHGMGLHPRLVHSRDGFHIVEVLGRRQGKPVPYAQVRERIALELAQRERAGALHRYIRQLAGRAVIVGVELQAARPPLVQ